MENKIISIETNKIYNNLYDMYIQESNFFETVTLTKYNKWSKDSKPMSETDFYTFIKTEHPRIITNKYYESSSEHGIFIKSIKIKYDTWFHIKKTTLNFKDKYEAMITTDLCGYDTNYTYSNKTIQAKSKIKTFLENIDSINNLESFNQYI